MNHERQIPEKLVGRKRADTFCDPSPLAGTGRRDPGRSPFINSAGSASHSHLGQLGGESAYAAGLPAADHPADQPVAGRVDLEEP